MDDLPEAPALKPDMPDLSVDLYSMEVDELIEYQQALTRARLAINEQARVAQAMLDVRVAEIAARRTEEDALLGQMSKPPAQDLFG